MNVLSLYDGISCGRVALEGAGIPVDKYVAYEIDDYAVKISKHNYPSIEHKGDVFDADFTEYKGYDLLIGGSPCTYWSIARGGGRETTPDGIGGKLFMQYVRALRESGCRYFLYENNFSIAQEIKDFISEQLGVQPIMINSALVSAQNRKRCYWTNIPGVVLPLDRNIKLNDVIDFEKEDFRPVSKWVYTTWGTKKKIDMLKTVNSEKSHTLTTNATHAMAYYLNADKTQYCNLKVKDWERLQTLPEGYTDNVDMPKGKKYKAIGNGWTVDVIAHILSFLPETAVLTDAPGLLDTPEHTDISGSPEPLELVASSDVPSFKELPEGSVKKGPATLDEMIAKRFSMNGIGMGCIRNGSQER